MITKAQLKEGVSEMNNDFIDISINLEFLWHELRKKQLGTLCDMVEDIQDKVSKYSHTAHLTVTMMGDFFNVIDERDSVIEASHRIPELIEIEKKYNQIVSLISE